MKPWLPPQVIIKPAVLPWTVGGAPLTFTLVLVRAVLAVSLAVAAQRHVHTLAAVALELALWAHGAVGLVAVVVALGVAVAAPRLRNAVHFARHALELLRGTGGRLCRRVTSFSFKLIYIRLMIFTILVCYMVIQHVLYFRPKTLDTSGRGLCWCQQNLMQANQVWLCNAFITRQSVALEQVNWLPESAFKWNQLDWFLLNTQP